jgi:hypothetical protein
MKTFFELNKDQQEEAVNYALNELRTLINDGIIHFPKSIPDSELREYAISAAEDAKYSEVGDHIIADIA